ncbi:MAG: extracellular solute-binding protein [Treponema sp.]|nr:extracellular solute-binding protein [Treponema sp.]
MKKLILLAIVLFTAALLMAGGAKAPSAPAAGAAAPAPGAPGDVRGVFPIVAQQRTFRLFAPQQPTIENIATNDVTQWYEKKTNIKIIWDLVPGANLAERRNLLLASNDLPDAFFYTRVSNAQQVIYGEQGTLIELNSLIDNYSKEIKAMFNVHPEYKDMVTTPNGKIYALPEVNETYHVMYSQKMWVFKPWLEKLNLKVPTTPEEFRQMLIAFRDKDPNGNGKKDEIPLAGRPSGGNSYLDGFLMCPYIYSDGGTRLLLKNGKIDAAFNKPEWRQGLDYLRGLYAEGLIYPASFTQNAEQLKQLGENPDVNLLGAVPGQWCGQWTENYGPSKRYMMWTAIPPLKGPGGKDLCGYYPFSGVISGQFAITKACNAPDLLFRWVDGLYSAESSIYIIAGLPERDWRWAKQGELGVDGRQGLYVNLTSYATVQNANWQGFSPRYRSSELKLGQVPNRPDHQEILLYNETKKSYDGKGPPINEIIPPLYFKEEDSIEVSAIEPSIVKIRDEFTARYVIGEISGDGAWNDYLKSLEAAGLKRYLQIQQKAYDTKYKR